MKNIYVPTYIYFKSLSPFCLSLYLPALWLLLIEIWRNSYYETLSLCSEHEICVSNSKRLSSS